MAINRREFLRTSLAGSAVILGSKLNGMNKTVSDLDMVNITDENNPPAKGKSVLGLRCKHIPTVRIGVVGLGRGGAAVNRLSLIEGTEIVALCDLNPERIKSSQKSLKNNKRKEAAIYTGDENWKKMCERDDIDLIYNATPCNRDKYPDFSSMLPSKSSKSSPHPPSRGVKPPFGGSHPIDGNVLSHMKCFKSRPI
ncbi:MULTISPECIES: hypothetical protein [unclassified Proteiniphilum]|jgi:hypothetical protein|uniref:hypothetical protein n=1 Tax=unclassified Proteiniphilum TaxID=2622718 RepID=UPI00257E9C4F|nr:MULTISPECIES: hypothetical protein [unclassified Proteiniphilum]